MVTLNRVVARLRTHDEPTHPRRTYELEVTHLGAWFAQMYEDGKLMGSSWDFNDRSLAVKAGKNWVSRVLKVAPKPTAKK